MMLSANDFISVIVAEHDSYNDVTTTTANDVRSEPRTAVSSSVTVAPPIVKREKGRTFIAFSVNLHSLRELTCCQRRLFLRYSQLFCAMLLEGDIPHQPFMHEQIVQWMPYNFAAESFHTKKLCSRLSSSKVHFYGKRKNCRLWGPRWGVKGNVRCSS